MEDIDSYSTDWETDSSSIGCNSPISATLSEEDFDWEFNGVQLNPDHLHNEEEEGGIKNVLLDSNKLTKSDVDKQTLNFILKQDCQSFNHSSFIKDAGGCILKGGDSGVLDEFGITEGGNRGANEDIHKLKFVGNHDSYCLRRKPSLIKDTGGSILAVNDSGGCVLNGGDSDVLVKFGITKGGKREANEDIPKLKFDREQDSYCLRNPSLIKDAGRSILKGGDSGVLVKFGITEGGKREANEDIPKLKFDREQDSYCLRNPSLIKDAGRSILKGGDSGVSVEFNTVQGGMCGANEDDTIYRRISTITEENFDTNCTSKIKGVSKKSKKVTFNIANDDYLDGFENSIESGEEALSDLWLTNWYNGFGKLSDICLREDKLSSSKDETFLNMRMKPEINGDLRFGYDRPTQQSLTDVRKTTSVLKIPDIAECSYLPKPPTIEKHRNFNRRIGPRLPGIPKVSNQQIACVSPIHPRPCVNSNGKIPQKLPLLPKHCVAPPTAPRPMGMHKSGRPFKLINIASPPPMRFVSSPPDRRQAGLRSSFRANTYQQHTTVAKEIPELEEVLPLDKIIKPFKKISKKLRRMIKGKKKQQQQMKYEEQMIMRDEASVGITPTKTPAEHKKQKAFQRIRSKIRFKSNKIDPIDAILQFTDCPSDKQMLTFPLHTPKKLITPILDCNAQKRPIIFRLRPKIRRDYIQRRHGVTSFVPVTKLANIAN